MIFYLESMGIESLWISITSYMVWLNYNRWLVVALPSSKGSVETDETGQMRSAGL